MEKKVYEEYSSWNAWRKACAMLEECPDLYTRESEGIYPIETSPYHWDDVVIPMLVVEPLDMGDRWAELHAEGSDLVVTSCRYLNPVKNKVYESRDIYIPAESDTVRAAECAVAVIKEILSISPVKEMRRQ